METRRLDHRAPGFPLRMGNHVIAVTLPSFLACFAQLWKPVIGVNPADAVRSLPSASFHFIS